MYFCTCIFIYITIYTYICIYIDIYREIIVCSVFLMYLFYLIIFKKQEITFLLLKISKGGLVYISPLSQAKSVASGSTMVPRALARSSLRRWCWTAPPGRVWFAPRSRWTARASGSTASPSRPTTAGRGPTASTARNPTSQWALTSTSHVYIMHNISYILI